MTESAYQFIRNKSIKSKYLHREVVYDIIFPKQLNPTEKLPTLYMNDGQDLDQLHPEHICNRHVLDHGQAFIWISIHTNHRRIQEYGTSYIADYKHRGALATEYMKFVILELMPLIQNSTPSSSKPQHNFFCGFSLGGLSAFDIVWENPHLFSKAGVFSGSFWWRSKSYAEGYIEDRDRIMHNKIKDGYYRKNLKFWFECGTNDEKADRNNDGVIDAIEDTLELITELNKLGYSKTDTTYVEVRGGEHNFSTWSSVFYSFLKWVLN